MIGIKCFLIFNNYFLNILIFHIQNEAIEVLYLTNIRKNQEICIEDKKNGIINYI